MKQPSRPCRRSWIAVSELLDSPVLPEPPACASEEPGNQLAPRLNCEWGYGSATFVTGTFGFAAAGWVVRKIAAG